MKSRVVLGVVVLVAAVSYGKVVEFWDFEDGVDGASFTPAGAMVQSGGSVGVNGVMMHGYDPEYGPKWTSNTSPNGGNLGMRVVNQDGYIVDAAFNAWTSPSWTLELHVRYEDARGDWETFVAMMGSSFGVSESDFYFQKADTDVIRLNFMPADAVSDGDRIILDGKTILYPGQWYGLAAVVDGDAGSVSLYVDQGDGYKLEAQRTGLSGNLGIYSSTAYAWAFFRDFFDKQGVDTTTGVMDNVRFCDTALDVRQLIGLQRGMVPLSAEEKKVDLGALISLIPTNATDDKLATANSKSGSKKTSNIKQTATAETSGVLGMLTLANVALLLLRRFSA